MTDPLKRATKPPGGEGVFAGPKGPAPLREPAPKPFPVWVIVVCVTFVLGGIGVLLSSGDGWLIILLAVCAIAPPAVLAFKRRKKP